MKVSIIIPNYNGEDLLAKHLPFVIDAARAFSKSEHAEIIVVDDCSTDNSLGILKAFAVKVIRNDKNLGFASTANRGVNEAQGDVVILLNTDVRPEKYFIEPLLKHFNDTEMFAVGCMDQSMENGRVILRGRGIGSWKKGFLMHARGEVDKTNTLWASGGSSAFRKTIWNILGGFNILYNPFYWEDIDISYRAQKLGYKVTFEPQSKVLHNHEQGAIKTHYTNAFTKKLSYRNQFLFTWINATDISLRFLHILWLPYHFIKAFLRGDFYFFIAFFEAITKLPQAIPYNLYLALNKKRSDKEIVSACNE